MNSFIAGKLGEVLAFARVGTDTIEKGKKTLREMLDQAQVDKMTATLSELAERTDAIAKKEGVEKEVHKQAKETEGKVTAMRDTYLDGEWESESELLEWMGFYTGASLVHWHLVVGAAEKMGLKDLTALGQEALEFYNNLFAADESTLQQIGASKAD